MQRNTLSEKFNIEVLQTLFESCSSASARQKGFCNTLDLVENLKSDTSIQDALDRTHTNLDQILAQSRKTENYQKGNFGGKVVFSPDLKATLLRSYLVAKDTSDSHVNMLHLFVASLYEPNISSSLKKLGVNIQSLENIVFGDGRPQNYPVNATYTGGAVLARYTEDLTKKASEGKLYKVVFREAELSQVTRILVRQTKNSVILIGENGVGKGALVELLAQKVNDGEVVGQLNDVKILKLNMSAFISALAGRSFNELIEMLQEELRALGPTIVFIKNFEFQNERESYEKTIIAHMIKTLVTGNEVRFILSMSSGSYKSLTSKESDFSEYFETVKIPEPSISLSIKIVSEVANRLADFHSISIPTEVVSQCVVLSKRYIQDKFLPSKAIDLLDEACSKAQLEGKLTISTDDIRTIISEKTGIPIEKLTVDEQKKLLDLEEILNKHVIGQEAAVHAVSEVVRRSRAGLKDPKKPIGSFLFLGPSGVGKTYLAKNLAKIVYDSESAMIRIDMSEFSQAHTVQRLIGSPPGYVGYGEGGQLTNPVWERPYSLILLDEIEKAHPQVFDIFLQVLDEGRLTDGQGRTVDFKNSIIIATSNIASDQILERLNKRSDKFTGFESERFYEEQILPLLKQHFRPEFINRFDEIVVFNPLSIQVLKIIGNLQIEKIQERLSEKNIKINISETKLTDFAKKSYNPAFGARPLIRLIQEKVENVIAKKILSGEIKEGDIVNI